MALPPSFTSFPDLDPGPSSRPIAKSDVKHSSHDKAKAKKRRRDHDVHPRRHVTNDEKLKAEEDRKRRDGEDASFAKPSTFYVDTKGDPLNLRYGGLHSGDVPKYRLVGRGRHIFGLPSGWNIVYRSGKGIEIGMDRSRRKMPGLTDSSSRALLATPPTRRPLYDKSGNLDKYQEIDGVIRISSGRDRVGKSQSYRSITVDKAPDSSSESDASERDDREASSDDDDYLESSSLTYLQETLKSLEQKLAADPSDERTWLSLLSYTLSTIPITSKNATKARSEITLSVLSRALSAHPENRQSDALRLKYLKAGEDIWHESKLRAEWEDAFKMGTTDIWMEWLDWRIRKGSQGFNAVADDCKRVLSALSEREDREMDKVRVFWRIAVAYRDAGFVERATAMFQAQAELTFEVPQALYGLPLDTLLESLEEFWESEFPRVGEDGAKGWAAWVSSGRSELSSLSPKGMPIAPADDNLDPYGRWASQETHTDQTCYLPTRSTDEFADSDPYSTILFSDIRPFLIPLHSQAAKHAFRLTWLSFIGLHVPGIFASSSKDIDDKWCYTHLTSKSYLAAIFPEDTGHIRLSADADAGVLIGREKQYASGFGPVKHWGHGVVDPLTIQAGVPEGDETSKRKCVIWGQEDVKNVDEAFARRIFVQLRLGTEDHEWDTLSLAFEAALNVKSALKLARTFLSTARDSLPHWAAYARLERLRGRVREARKVYQTTLSMSTPNLSRIATGQLWWDWAEMEWLSDGSIEAQRVILQAAGVTGEPGGVSILRAKRAIDNTVAILDQSQWKEKGAWIMLRALLELLSTDSPVATNGLLDAYLSDDHIDHLLRERVTLASLVMLYQYGTVLKNPTPPSVLRERAERAVNTYPSNSIILGLFLEGEKGQGLWGRIRGILGEGAAGVQGQVTSKDVARRVAEVWIAGWERGRWQSEIERTRSGLAAAVLSTETKGSAILWRIYIEFEIRAGQLERAKKILFRAIGECPFVKEFYLLAFGPLRRVFSGQELNGFADTMAERELRMRRGLDEMVGAAAEEESSDGDESGDEIEASARELRRLMPY